MPVMPAPTTRTSTSGRAGAGGVIGACPRGAPRPSAPSSPGCRARHGAVRESHMQVLKLPFPVPIGTIADGLGLWEGCEVAIVEQKWSALPVPFAVEVPDRIPKERYYDPDFYRLECEL